jgi:hypothetical protein
MHEEHNTDWMITVLYTCNFSPEVFKSEIHLFITETDCFVALEAVPV